MVKKVLLPIFILILVGMVVFVLWPKKNSKSNITSIKSALVESKQTECDYIDVDGFTTKTYIKAGMLRSDFTGKTLQDAGSVLIRSGKSYVWWTKDKRGFVASSADDNANQKNKLISDIEKYK